MKYKVFTLLLVAIIFGMPMTAQDKKLPEFSWDTMPLYMHLRKDTEFTKEEIQFIAKHPLITFEKTTGSRTYGGTEKGTIKAAERVKELNSEAKILYYKNVVINWPSYQEDEAFLKKHPEAILVDENGKKGLMLIIEQVFLTSHKNKFVLIG